MRYELSAPSEELVFNAQAALTFTLINTNLVALFKKEGSTNTFLVLPTDKTPSGGMSIKDMVADINKMMKGYDPKAAEIKDTDVVAAVKDAEEASKKSGTENKDSNVDYLALRVELRQAFLYLQTGKKVEYAFEIDVDASELFPKDVTFFNVRKLAVGFWNTNRKSILERMGFADFDAYLAVE
ncbi:MAG: hypothetical protein LIQ30_08570 [Planctomycetes bacterium]|nr:hypothetical protein [Planctomycetota bacterium]